ncbi:MAG: MmgE/PrpD family protein [Planctomycetes bacterium]|nr:MmgE/PrpD family protein [Planctomycetota bacterium]
MSASEGTATGRLADWIAAVRYEDIPERVLALARGQILSVLASLFAGSRTAAASAVRRAVLRRGAPGPASVLPTGERVSVSDAILANAASSVALDHDDYLFLGHTGHTAVLASWALAEAGGLPARDVLLAQVVANEIGGRVAASTLLGPQNGQTWSFLHAAAGAALASKLLGLSARETAHALGIALYQPTFTLMPGFMGSDAKALTAAVPAAAGVEAALLAREGMTGPLDVLEHPTGGFWSFFAYAPLPHMLTGLSRAWITDTLAFKKYPGCAYIDTAMDALFEVLDEFRRDRGRPLAPDDVLAVEVRASLLTVEMDNLSADSRCLERGTRGRSEEHGTRGALSPERVNFSIPASAAIAILAGRLSGAEFEPDRLASHAEEIRFLAQRVTLRHDWDMTLEVADAFDAALGENGIAAALSPRDLLAVLLGYRSRMGGHKRTPLRWGSLLARHPRALLSRAFRAAGRRRLFLRKGGDLGAVDFTRFRMVFPASVELVTRDGKRYAARRDIPDGAPGGPDRLGTAAAKFREEAGRFLSPERVERALARVLRFESSSVAELAREIALPNSHPDLGYHPSEYPGQFEGSRTMDADA